MTRLRSFALSASRQRLLAPLLLLGCFFALAGGYRSAIPLFEGPDESSHIEYAVLVAEHGRLPGREIPATMSRFPARVISHRSITFSPRPWCAGLPPTSRACCRT